MERLMANKTKATPEKEEMWDKGPEIYPAAFLSLWTELTPIKLKAIIAAFKRLRPYRRMNVHPAVFSLSLRHWHGAAPHQNAGSPRLNPLIVGFIIKRNVVAFLRVVVLAA